MSTFHHAQFWAHALTLRGSADSVDGLSRAISNARVDLNPHQVDAALFALRWPLTRGVMLADEVGLGKTIEAALVISQRWAEKRRRILVVVPAALRRQWQQELAEKFFLPSLVLESKSRKKLFAEGKANPFDLDDQIVICSYQFAAASQEQVAAVPWDLVVIDEAHRLRNIYKPGAKTAKAIAAAVGARPKLLLTATRRCQLGARRTLLPRDDALSRSLSRHKLPPPIRRTPAFAAAGGELTAVDVGQRERDSVRHRGRPRSVADERPT